MPSNESNNSRPVKVYGKQKSSSRLKLLSILVAGGGAIAATGTIAFALFQAEPEPPSLEPEVQLSVQAEEPEPVAPAESPAPDNYSLALERVAAAETLADLAMSPDDWRLVASRWEQIISLLQTVPQDHASYQDAQAQLRSAEAALASAQQGQSRTVSAAPANPQPPAPSAPQPAQVAQVPANAETWQVLRVADGDTITVTRNGQQERVRSACIDAPEGDQPLGPESGARLQQLIDQAGGQVELIVTDRDRYGRMIAEIYAGSQFTQAVLVREGLAWSYRQFHRNCPSADLINQIEAQARQQRVGVFSGGHIEPWEWRRGNR